MTGIQFVPSQTGTSRDDSETRKAIRRHVMLGKNQGRRPKNPKRPSITGAAVFKKEEWQPTDHRLHPVVPRRVGSDFSLLGFADTVELSLMSETLQFCSTTNENLFILEPCISFDSKDAVAMCVEAVTGDALFLNVMVFGTQVYMDIAFRQATSELRRSNCKASSQHYGKALYLLRERLADVESQRSQISDITIMAVSTLAIHALVTGDSDSARNHAVGLSRLVSMREDGLYSFRSKTKQIIEYLRCDISISLATGQAPLFFPHSSHESIFPLPDLPGLDTILERSISINNSELAKTWKILSRFCAMINEATVDRKKLSGKLFLDTMASVMYRVLNILVTPGSIEETIRFAMLSFCASAFLSWRHLRMPSTWLQLQYKASVTRLMQSQLAFLDPELVLWFLMVYGITFPPLSLDEHEKLHLWLVEVASLCRLTNWEGVKETVGSFLWIDIVGNRAAQKLVDETFIRHF